MALRLDRAQVLAYRAWAQGLPGEDTLAGLDVLAIGLHRRADLPLVRAALRAYLGGFGDTLIAYGADGPALLAQVAARMRATFPGAVATKGELSGAVSPGLPDVVRPWCEGCGTARVADGMFRLATLYDGVELRTLTARCGKEIESQAEVVAAARAHDGKVVVAIA